MTEEEKDRRIEAIMAMCDCSYAEAEFAVMEDEQIEHGERLDWELTVEEERELRKANKLSVERKTSSKRQPSQRAPDLTKRDIIDKIKDALISTYPNTTVTNPEKTIEIEVGEERYSIDLRKHRSPVSKSSEAQ